MILQPYDIVVVPFPHADLPTEKRRPALVISRPEVEIAHGWLWLAMITSAPGDLLYGDAPVTDLPSTGLARACRVRASKTVTLDRTLVIRRSGALVAADRVAVGEALAACVGW